MVETGASKIKVARKRQDRSGRNMSQQNKIPKWGDNNDYILKKIRETRSTLKIILKAKDETYFLKKWYEHHRKIVSPSSIIIFDNMSSNRECLRFYETIRDDSLLLQFEGLHNNVHDTRIFAEFYEAIADSSRYFVFLDSDEFLFSYGDGRLTADEELARGLERGTKRVFPALWLENMPGSDCVFNMGEASLNAGLRWGKPIILSSSIPKGYINHNSQVPQAHYDAEIDINYVILHLSKLFTQQRIDVNINKLRQRSFFRTDDLLREVMQADISCIDNRHIRAYVSEIQDAVNNPFETRQFQRIDSPLSEEMLCADIQSGEMKFFDKKQRELFERYLRKDSPDGKILRPVAGRNLQRHELDPKLLSIKPHMTTKEVGVFCRHIENASFLLEFGSGGSTVMAAALGVKEIVSVDSSLEWLQKVAETEEVKRCIFTSHHVDIGKLTNWGNPADKSSAISWPAYYRSVWNVLKAEPDVILVDGRFRVACAFMSILHAQLGTKIIVHDFWDRPYYHDILKYLDCIDREHQIGVFIQKSDLDWRDLAKTFSRYVLDYR